MTLVNITKLLEDLSDLTFLLGFGNMHACSKLISDNETGWERVVLTESTTESVDVVFNSGQQAPRGRGGSSQKREEVDKIQVS